MFGVEPLARIVRNDARIEVKVPASQGRKAYSYYREGLYQEEAGGTFSSDGSTYDINKIFKITQKKEARETPVTDLEWILRFTPNKKSDRARTAKADLSAPIIVTRQKGRSVVVDGVHRLKKAKLQGLSSLKAVSISPIELGSTRISNSRKQDSLYSRIDALRDRLAQKYSHE